MVIKKQKTGLPEGFSRKIGLFGLQRRWILHSTCALQTHSGCSFPICFGDCVHSVILASVFRDLFCPCTKHARESHLGRDLGEQDILHVHLSDTICSNKKNPLGSRLENSYSRCKFLKFHQKLSGIAKNDICSKSFKIYFALENVPRKLWVLILHV